MSRHYEYDRINFSFRKVSRSVWNVLALVLRYVIVTFSLAVIYYAVFSLLVSTDTERRLRKENKLYAKVYGEMVERESLVSDVIDGLQARDNEIYGQVFHSEAPSIDPVGQMNLLASGDPEKDRDIVNATAAKADRLLAMTARVEENFARVTGTPADSLPPLSLPLENISYAQVGASVGEKVNPFYKVPSRHSGLDLIAPQGDQVLACADGRVSRALHSRKGQGNVVEIVHAGGYVSVYAHLSDIYVRPGQNVKRGGRIGSVGTSGNSFAPHLHFELLHNGETLDPVNYFFASVSAADYANMLYMSVHTEQSMD